MTAGTRTTLIVALAAAASLVVAAGVAQAAAGDDAHAVTALATGVPNTGTSPIFVPCPAGEVAIGGGQRTNPTHKGSVMIETSPWSNGSFLGAGGTPTQWYSRMNNLSGAGDNYAAYAVCSATSDATTRFVDFSTPDMGAASEASTTVPCAANERAISGGVFGTGAPPISLEASMPLSAQGTIDSLNDNDVARSWYVNVRTNGGTSLRAYALCSPTSTATIQVETVFIPGNGYILNLYVPCPSGQRALSGGVGTMQPNLTPAMEANAPGNAIGGSLPSTGGVPGGWFARIAHHGPAGGASYRVAAICEAPTPGVTPQPPPPPADPANPAQPGDPVDPLNPNTPLPSNAFKFGKFFGHPDRGVGALVVKVPGPGEVQLRSKKLKFQANVAPEAGDVGLSVLAAKGGPTRKLHRTGKLKAKAAVTFTPDGGAPNRQKTKVKLEFDLD